MAVLDDLDYADDIGLLSSKHQDDRQMAERLSKTANTHGLKVNTKKDPSSDEEHWSERPSHD